jgi:hypothetical protein
MGLINTVFIEYGFGGPTNIDIYVVKMQRRHHQSAALSLVSTSYNQVVINWRTKSPDSEGLKLETAM